MNPTTVLLVVAKAPVSGKAKTRLTPPASPEQAAEIAAAGLLDTIDAVRRTPDAITAVAWTGESEAASGREELIPALAGAIVVLQRGRCFADRLVAAHADIGRARPGYPVFQIGMDTPQVRPDLLAASTAPLHEANGPDAVLGPASDGGWWALGVREPGFAEVLRDVPMSCPDTGDQTLRALRAAGLRVELLPELSDVDTMVDAQQVAQQVPGSRFAAAVQRAMSTGNRQ